MGEVVACLVVGFVLGLVVGGAGAYDKGFKAGMSWALTRYGFSNGGQQ